MQLHWKFGVDYKLHFMYCSYIEFFNVTKTSSEQNLYNTFKPRADIENIYEVDRRKSNLKFKNIICLSCDRDTISEKMILVSNDWIIRYYNRRKNTEKKLPGESDYFHPGMTIPLYFRKKYDINQFNVEKIDLFLKDTKFKKHKETPVCMACYLNIIDYIQESSRRQSQRPQSTSKSDNSRVAIF